MNKPRSIMIAIAIVSICVSYGSGDISITKPKEKDMVNWKDKVEGSFSASFEPILGVCVFVKDLNDKDSLWDIYEANPHDGKFSSDVTFGHDPKIFPAEIDHQFEIVAMIISNTTNATCKGSTSTIRELPKPSRTNESISVNVTKDKD